MEDSIVKKIHKTRAKILKECKYDIRSFTELANTEAEQFKKDQSQNSHKVLMEKLKSNKLAAECLTSAIAENNGQAFLTAVKNILEVRGICQASDLTLAGLAKKLGTAAATLSKLSKNGVKQITIGTLDKIADALDMELIIKLKTRKAA